MQFYRELFYLIGNDKLKLIFMVIFFIFASLLDLIGIGIIGPFISIILDSNNFKYYDLLNKIIFLEDIDQSNIIIYFCIFLLIVFFFKFIFSIYIIKVITNFGYNQKYKVQKNLMNIYQSMSYKKFTNRNSSDYIHSIKILTDMYRGIIMIALKLVSDLLVAILIILFLAYINILALFIMMALLLVSAVIYDFYFKRKLDYFGKVSNVSSIDAIKVFNESINGLKEIRILKKEKYFHQLFNNFIMKENKYSARAQFITSIPRSYLEFLMIIFLVIFVTSYLLMGYEMLTIAPILGTFGIAALRLMPAANTFLSSIVQFRFNKYAISLLYKDHIDKDSEYLRNFDDIHLKEFDSLSIENIYFKYNNNSTYLLEKINLKISRGQIIGIIGSSGSGKTSLVDLIMGLHKPDQGSVKINNQNIFNVLGSWRRMVAYIPQDIFLIDDSIKKNIALGIKEDDIDTNLLQRSIINSSLDKLVNGLPDGYETNVGENGLKISGGQKQRIAIARAFYHNRDFLILDESTSSLDQQTEDEIINEISKLKNNKTIIIISHKLNSLRHCDKVLNLNHSYLNKIDE